jgi:hypothetical protein
MALINGIEMNDWTGSAVGSLGPTLASLHLPVCFSASLCLSWLASASAWCMVVGVSSSDITRSALKVPFAPARESHVRVSSSQGCSYSAVEGGFKIVRWHY